MTKTKTQPQKLGVQLSVHQVIVRPLVTEKGVHKATRHNQYSFEVNPLATKYDIRDAIEELFNVTVTRVATQTRKGKSKRYKNKLGLTRNWKKAIVTLDEESRIDFF